MIFNKKAQYAILLGTYLSRAGRANLKDVSINLNLSLSFLEQIARLMRIGGVVGTMKGPGGGTALVGDPTIGAILKSVGIIYAMPDSDLSSYNHSGVVEHRALGLFSDFTNKSISRLLNVTCSGLVQGLVAREVSILDQANELNAVN